MPSIFFDIGPEAQIDDIHRFRDYAHPTDSGPDLVNNMSCDNAWRLFENTYITISHEIRQRYHPSDAAFIIRALDLATFAHQSNHDLKARRRKNGELYIMHPIAIAQHLMQANLDAITIAAALLHDVVEDVDLGDGLKAAAWINQIQTLFGNTARAQTLTEVIAAVTEPDLPTNLNHEMLQKHPLYRVIADLIEETSGTLGEKDQEKILHVVYSLLHVFESATKSPEHWRAFFIKIADICENLDGKMKDVKLLRGRIAANLATFLGWREMSDLIISRLEASGIRLGTQIKNFKLDAHAADNDHPLPLRADDALSFSILNSSDRLFDQMSDAQDPIGVFVQNWLKPTGQQRTSVQYAAHWHMPSTRQQREAWDDAPRSVLVLKTDPNTFRIINDHISLHTHQPKTVFRHSVPISDKHPGILAVLSSCDDNQSVLSSLLGRDAAFYKCKLGQSPATYIALEVNKPTIRDYVTNGSAISPDQIPEAGLLNPLAEINQQLYPSPNQNITPNMHTDHLLGMIALFYDPDFAVQRSEHLCIVKYKTSADRVKACLANGDMPVKDMLTYLNKPFRQERKKPNQTGYTYLLSDFMQNRTTRKHFSQRIVNLTNLRQLVQAGFIFPGDN